MFIYKIPPFPHIKKSHLRWMGAWGSGHAALGSFRARRGSRRLKWGDLRAVLIGKSTILSRLGGVRGQENAYFDGFYSKENRKKSLKNHIFQQKNSIFSNKKAQKKAKKKSNFSTKKSTKKPKI
jgi:hypothetical protein